MYVTHADKVRTSRASRVALNNTRKRALLAVAHISRHKGWDAHRAHMENIRIETAYSLALCELLSRE